MSDANSTSIELSNTQESSVDTQESWDIRWRRNKIMQLLSQGKTQREIAQELNVHESTISRDIQKIKEEIDSEHENWVKHIAFENELALNGLTEVLKDLWNIARDERLDVNERMKAYLLIMECYKKRGEAIVSRPFIKYLKREYEDWLELERRSQGWGK